jgi:hypothetical protein
MIATIKNVIGMRVNMIRNKKESKELEMQIKNDFPQKKHISL